MPNVSRRCRNCFRLESDSPYAARPRISEVVQDTKVLLQQSRERLVISRTTNDLSSYDTSKYNVAIVPSADGTGVDPAAVDDVIMGCVSQIGPQSLDIARNAWLSAGLPESVPGVTIDRQCGSSQQAIHFAAQAVMSGTQDLVVAAGVNEINKSRSVSKGHNVGLQFYRISTCYADVLNSLPT